MDTHEQAKVRKALGEKLRDARESARLTQLDVATAAGVHVNFYARMERGEENPSFEKLQSVMKVLGIKSLELF
jgi:transcriptional regulator with XRE-family HTH domain